MRVSPVGHASFAFWRRSANFVIVLVRKVPGRRKPMSRGGLGVRGGLGYIGVLLCQ